MPTRETDRDDEKKPAAGNGPDTAAKDPGRTRSTAEGEPSPRLPHEHDESSDSGSTAPREVMKQAAADVESGKVPTDRSTETDELYARTLRDGRDHDDTPDSPR